MLKKCLTLLLALTLVLGLSCFAFGYEADMLTITGPGVEKTLTIPLSELAEISASLNQTVSAVNNYPTAKIYYARGLSVIALLEKAGLKDNATIVTIAALDPAGQAGYAATLLKSDLFAERYYFPETGEAIAVLPLLALASGSSAETPAPALRASIVFLSRLTILELNIPRRIYYTRGGRAHNVSFRIYTGILGGNASAQRI